LRPIDPTQSEAVKGSAHPLARPEFDRGRINSDQPISGALVFRLSPAEQADLDRLLRDQQNPSSPDYHRWLTPEQYADRFGMSKSDIAKAGAWLSSEGLFVNGVSRGRTELYFSGSAAQVENAFRTEIHRYVMKGEDHFANATPLSVPHALADVVLTVRGIDNFRPHPHTRFQPMRSRGVSANFTSDISGRHFLNRADFAVIYDLDPLYNAGLDGAEVKIAVIGQSTISAGGNATDDLDLFRSAAGLVAKQPTFVQVPSTGNPTFRSSDATEADLDLEWSNAVAENADVIYVFSGNTGDAFRAISHVINQGLSFAQIISNSFGLCETDLGQSSALALWQTIRQGNSQGQTMTTASGDTGASDCEGDLQTTPASATLGLGVDMPAAIPEATSVGGAEFTGDSVVCDATAGCPTTPLCPDGSAPADSPFWLGACALTSAVATAEEYIPEMAWNDSQQDGQPSAGGGGASTFFAKPSWQAGTGVPADGARDVPDVALSASADHDSYLICSQPFYVGLKPPIPTSCTNGFRASDKTLTAIGGTSAGAPTFAGILALILQASIAAGKGPGLGNVNPMLYSLAASSPGAFHDITSGDNKVPCTSGTKNCPAGTTKIGFSAGQGYDQATGLGSVDASALKTAWLAALASPSPDFVIDGQSSTVTPGIQGTATLNITAVNGFADTVNLTCSPSSQTAQITCSLNPASVDLTSSVKTVPSTLSITTVAALDPPQLPHSNGTWLAATGGLFAAVLFGIPSRRRWMGLLPLVLVATAIGAIGCGGGGGGTPQQKAQGTPAGTYVITVTATGANTGASHSMAVSLTVR
jgi:subtilase family serine protease